MHQKIQTSKLLVKQYTIQIRGFIMKKKLIVLWITLHATIYCPMDTEKKIEKLTDAQPATEAKKSKFLKIEAHIDKDKDLGYKKFFSTYYPEDLTIKVNGKKVYEIKKNKVVNEEEVTIPVDENKLVVEYEYQWDMITGKRTGTKRAEFNVDQNADKLDLRFGSWKNDNRIVIPQATQIGKEEKIK